MLKALFISTNLLALIMLPFLYLGDIDVEHTTEAQEMTAGEEMEVEITINKGKISGPARLKLDLSDAKNIIVESIEKSGASFSSSGDNIVYTWSEIPSSDIITIKYKIIADPSASGTKTISGVLSYLDESERKKYDIPNIIFDILPADNVIAQTDPIPDPVVVPDPDPVVTKVVNPMDVVSCFRVVENDGDNFIVSLNIEKGEYGGFARVKEVIPDGFIATKLQTENSVFTAVDNTVKFIWTSIPKDKSSLKLVYKLSPETASAGDYEIAGEFSGQFLIIDDIPKKFSIPKTIFSVKGDLVQDKDPDKNESDQEVVDTETSDTKTSTEISTPAISGVTYKVQILAAHKNVSSRYIKKRYGYSGKVDLENHDGWVKYITGSYNIYKEARDKRETLNSYDLPGPFVTAYNSGERISVQEALTITSQDWVK